MGSPDLKDGRYNVWLPLHCCLRIALDDCCQGLKHQVQCLFCEDQQQPPQACNKLPASTQGIFLQTHLVLAAEWAYVPFRMEGSRGLRSAASSLAENTHRARHAPTWK